MPPAVRMGFLSFNMVPPTRCCRYCVVLHRANWRKKVNRLATRTELKYLSNLSEASVWVTSPPTGLWGASMAATRIMFLRCCTLLSNWNMGLMMQVTRVMGSQFLHSWTSGGAQRIFLFKLMLSPRREVPISADLYGVPQSFFFFSLMLPICSELPFSAHSAPCWCTRYWVFGIILFTSLGRPISALSCHYWCTKNSFFFVCCVPHVLSCQFQHS